MNWGNKQFKDFDAKNDTDTDVNKIALPLHSNCQQIQTSGPGCSKQMTSLVNVSIKFQMLISEICQYLLLKNVRSFCNFFNKKYQFICL